MGGGIPSLQARFGRAVYRYEPLRKCELNSRIRKGWKVVR